MAGRLQEQQRAAVRRAAHALSAQDGNGIRRNVMVELVAPGNAVTLETADGHVLAVVEAIAGSAACFASLSPREREVAHLLAHGASNAEIAEALVISVGTVKDHVHRILEKTELRSRAAVAGAWHDGDPQSA
jgi:DNA-binding NarL/FixJ family response regulator